MKRIGIVARACCATDTYHVSSWVGGVNQRCRPCNIRSERQMRSKTQVERGGRDDWMGKRKGKADEKWEHHVGKLWM